MTLEAGSEPLVSSQGLHLVRLELELETPTIIVEKRGESSVASSLEYIPASTLLGAIAAAELRRRIIDQKGACAGISRWDDPVHCDSCSISEECLFPAIRSGVVISTAAAFLPSEGGSHHLPWLETAVVKLQDGLEVEADAALELGLIRAAALGKANPSIFYARGVDHAKRRPSPAAILEGRLVLSHPPMVEVPHVAISPIFRASEVSESTRRGFLVTRVALKDGIKFAADMVLPTRLIKALWDLLRSSELWIGQGRSRGLGRVRAKITKELNLETAKDVRSKEIVEWGEKLRELTRDYVEGRTIITATGLSHLRHESPGRLLQYLLRKTGITDVRVEAEFYTLTTRRLFDRGSFVLIRAVRPGWVVILSLDGDSDLQAIASELAGLEILKPGWVRFNHPVHVLGSTLGGDMS